jgi:hypothetical protein
MPLIQKPFSYLSEPREEAHPTSFRDEEFNSGIAVLVPAGDILHVLNQQRFVTERKLEMENLVSSRGTTVDTRNEPPT